MQALERALGLHSLIGGIHARAQDMLTGGGTATWHTTLGLKWSQRFIAISVNGRTPNWGTDGFFNIDMPANGVAIPIANDSGIIAGTTITVASGHIPMPAWSALYYVLPIGSVYTSLPANFRVVMYEEGAPFDVPPNWVMVAVRNDDVPVPSVKLGTGEFVNTYTIPAGSTHLDVPVDPAWGLVTIDFEATLSSFQDFYVRPNAHTGNLLCHERFNSSTAAPDAVSGWSIQIPSLAGFRIFPGAGAAGKTKGMGTLQVQLRNDGTRRTAQVQAVQTNTLGSGNHFAYDWASRTVIDGGIGVSTALTYLRFLPLTGTIDAGTIRVRR